MKLYEVGKWYVCHTLIEKHRYLDLDEKFKDHKISFDNKEGIEYFIILPPISE